MAGLYEGNPKRETDSPTAVRILKAFKGISRVHMPNKGSPKTTPLSGLQRQILAILEISEEIYQTPKYRFGLLKNWGRRWSQVSRKIAHAFTSALNRAKNSKT
jgi:hypothetical protein